MMPTTSCPPAPTPHHQPRCLVSPLWLFLFIALAVFLQDQLSKNSKTTFLKINSGGDQVDPPPTVHNTKFSFLKYIYKWENISVIYIPKKKQKQYCYFIYYLSISRIFSWNWFINIHSQPGWTQYGPCLLWRFENGPLHHWWIVFLARYFSSIWRYLK